jgi:capsule polysaccharide export protein KpsE/RkpR
MLDAKKEETREAFDENIDITYETEGNYTITVWDKSPEKAATIANDYISIANGLSQKLYHSEASANREYLEKRLINTESALKLVSDSLEKFSSKHMLFQPEAQATAISQSLSELKAELMMQEVRLDQLLLRFGEKDAYTNAQRNIVADLRRRIQDAESKPGFGGNFALRNATEVGIEYMRLYTEYETFSKVKAFLMPILEEAKLNEFRSTKNLYVVDSAQSPERKSRPKRSVIVAGTGLGSLVLAVLFILGIQSYRNFKEHYSQVINNNQIKEL